MIRKAIDYEKCTSCMACERICTASRVIAINDQGLPEFKNNHKCIYCGHCLAICPQEAIRFEVDSSQNSEKRYIARPYKPDSPDWLPGESLLFDFLASTRSNRYFLDQPVEKTKLTRVIDAMVRAPSAGNEQNRNYYILSDKERIDRLESQIKEQSLKSMQMYGNPLFCRIISFIGAAKKPGDSTYGMLKGLGFRQRYDTLMKIMKTQSIQDNEYFTYMKNAHALVIVTSSPINSMLHRDFYRGDISIAVTYGILAARAMGLESCWMGLLEIFMNKNKAMLTGLGIKESERIDGALVLGYSDLKWVQVPLRGPVKVTWL